jgi:hypothetical protein
VLRRIPAEDGIICSSRVLFSDLSGAALAKTEVGTKTEAAAAKRDCYVFAKIRAIRVSFRPAQPLDNQAPSSPVAPDKGNDLVPREPRSGEPAFAASQDPCKTAILGFIEAAEDRRMRVLLAMAALSVPQEPPPEANDPATVVAASPASATGS